MQEINILPENNIELASELKKIKKEYKNLNKKWDNVLRNMKNGEIKVIAFSNILKGAFSKNKLKSKSYLKLKSMFDIKLIDNKNYFLFDFRELPAEFNLLKHDINEGIIIIKKISNDYEFYKSLTDIENIFKKNQKNNKYFRFKIIKL